MWKRRQAILKWEWDLTDDEDVEEIRPEFEANVKSRRWEMAKNKVNFFFFIWELTGYFADFCKIKQIYLYYE